jgi:hypothetical protein
MIAERPLIDGTIALLNLGAQMMPWSRRSGLVAPWSKRERVSSS